MKTDCIHRFKVHAMDSSDWSLVVDRMALMLPVCEKRLFKATQTPLYASNDHVMTRQILSEILSQIFTENQKNENHFECFS